MGPFPQPIHETPDSHIYMLACTETKPRYSSWQEAVSSTTWNQHSISWDQMESSAQRFSHSSSVCPWHPAQKLSAPRVPGEWEIIGFWDVFLVTESSRWKVCWIEGNRPSLSNPARRQAALSHIPLGPTEQLGLLPLSMLPALQGWRSSCPTAQLT